MSDVFADAESVPDRVWAAACDHARTTEEHAFRDVLDFHRDILNGGLAQALWNKRSNIASFIAAYNTLGLGTLGDLIALANNTWPTGNSYSDMEAIEELDTLTSIYVAATYNLAYTCAGNRDDADFPTDGDWVERIALRFARTNRSQFKSLIAAAEV